MTLPTGTRLSQRYEIRAFVGSDGTLEVYKGLDLRLGRDVAVTVLEIRTIQDPEKLMRFETEAQVRAGLHHPRIMTIHDFGHDASCAFQVAEWLDGQSLRKRLKSGLLEWTEAVRIGRAILEGLAVIHEKGFTLHVLDSASVFLQRDRSVKLFAYELKRIDGPDGPGFRAADSEGVRSLARLLIRCLAGENPAPAAIAQSRELAALRELSENAELSPAELHATFNELIQDTSLRPRARSHGRWIAAVTLLLCVPSLAVLYSRRSATQTAPLAEAKPAPESGPEEAKPARDSDARRLFLYGMQLLDNRDTESLHRAQTYLQGAITRDPAYALAHSGLADCYSRMGLLGVLPRDEAQRLSQASIQRALEIDPRLGEAHASMAFQECWYKLNWKEAEKEYLIALSLTPREASIHHGYGTFLVNMGRVDDGLQHLGMALEQQPLSRPYRTSYAIYLHWAGQPEKSLNEFAKALEQDPSHRDTLLDYREVLEQLGRIEEAFRISQRLAELGAIPDREASALKTAFETQGAKGYWKERVRQQEQVPEPVRLAELVALQGDKDRAFRLLARALREGSLLAARIPRDPAFEPLRRDPRFQQLLKHMGYRES